VGGLPEVVDDGVNGFLHDPRDVTGMAASLIRIVTDDALRDRLGAAGRAAAIERFSAARVVPMYEAAYEALVARAR
jgi:glycosyltransferase involved in cell wall biosynthesis